jgi:hypothetical protein
LISSDDLPLPVIYDGGPRIYRNGAALPAALVVHRARVIEDEEARLAALFDPAFDPRAEVLLGRAPASPLPQDGAAQVQAAQPEPAVRRTGPGEVVLQVSMVQPGYLVLTDTYYPGWQATVDGRQVEILPADHAFRAIGLGAGEHTVVFGYAPASFRLGAWSSLGATLLLAVTLIAGLRRRRAA